MRETVRIVLGLAIAASSFLGCAVYPGTARPAALEDLRREEGWILLDSVPFVPQASQKGCGAACLAMVLGHWDNGCPVETLEAECAVPGQDGIRASALRDAARRRGLSAFLIQGSVADLEHELSRGRPVVVGVLKPRPGGVTSHFEVVVGLHPGRKRIATLDPAIGLTSDSLAGFEDEWRPTKGVTLVVFLPEVETTLTMVDALERGGGL
jgi:ABC-type bacteriocin/lantibiotic exporter with double-glycine peptidase domain